MSHWPETRHSLILRVKDSADAVAWSAFMAIYRPVVFRLARSRGLQEADADDLTQQVFTSISRAVERWEPAEDGPPFRAWLYRIAHNEILRTLTRRKPDTATGSDAVAELLNDVPHHDGPDSEQLIREARREAFRWAAGEIRDEFSNATWDVFRECTIEGQPVNDVAKRHGKSRGAVYLIRFRVMNRLKEKLDEVSDIWSHFS